MNFDQKIGAKLKTIRKAEGLTQVELAEKAGITQGFLTKVETGKTAISLENFVNIVSSLEYSVQIEKGDLKFYKIG